MKKSLLFLAAGTMLMSAASCTKDYTCTCTYSNYFGTGASFTEVRNLESTTRAAAAAGCPENVTQTIGGQTFGGQTIPPQTMVGICDLDD